MTIEPYPVVSQPEHSFVVVWVALEKSFVSRALGLAGRDASVLPP